MPRFWPTGKETTAGVPAGALQSSASSVASSDVTTDAITLDGIVKGHNYRVTIDFSAGGVFGDARYRVRAVCNDVDAVLTEELSAKTEGKVSLLLFIRTACAHSWDYYNPLSVTLQLEGAGWTGADLALSGLVAVVQEIA